MDTLRPQLASLTSQIDTLETALQPLLTPLTTTSSTLPLLDKAKLHVLTTYALESLLFTTLRLSGTDAKAHPVFAELARVKEYYAKIGRAEEMGADGARSGAGRLNTEAARRFIKAGLSGNERYDRERKEREERERMGAKRKLEEMGVGTHTRFEGPARRIRKLEEGESIGVVRAEDVDDEEDDREGEAEFNEAADEIVESKPKGKKSKGKKARNAEDEEGDPMAALEESLADPVSTETSSPANGKAKGSKKKKKNKKR